MKRIALLAVPLLVVGLLAGCGDDGGDAEAAAEAPKNATVEEFCQPFVDLVKEMSGVSAEDVSDEEAVRIAKEAADELAKAGTPEDIPADARKGFELILEKLEDLPDDATKEDVEQFSQLTDEEQKYADAFTRYLAEKCSEQMMAAGSAG